MPNPKPSPPSRAMLGIFGVLATSGMLFSVIHREYKKQVVAQKLYEDRLLIHRRSERQLLRASTSQTLLSPSLQPGPPSPSPSSSPAADPSR